MNNLINTSRMNFIRTVYLIIFILAGSLELTAQDKIVNVQVNRFWGGVSEQGSKTSFTHPNLTLFADYDAYGARLQGNETYFGGFIAVACQNWTDANGKTYPFAVFSPTNSYMPSGKVITPLQNYVRYPNPAYNVEQKNIPPIVTNLGTVDATKCVGTSDQSVIVTNEYACGVQVQRKILAWSQQNHDNYVITDLTFTNKSNNTLNGFYISLQEGDYYMILSDGSNPSVATVDQYGDNNWAHYYGPDQNDSLRVMYQYSADDPTRSGDQMAQPLSQQNGRLLDKDFFFLATLHASKQPYTPSASYTGYIDPNDLDDKAQPKVAVYANLQNSLALPLYPLNDPGSKLMYDFISGTTLASEDQTGANVWPGGHYRKNLDDMGLVNAGGQPGISANSDNFESLCFSYGPYTFTPGQQIRIVKVSGFAGISREKSAEIGKQWLASQQSSSNKVTDPLPNAANGRFPANFKFPADAKPWDITKDKWFSTGIDSVMLTVSRAKWNFTHNYNVPVTPPPPTEFTVLGTGQGIELTWSNTAAEAMSNFDGYRIMRKVSNRDTTFYEQVTRIPASDKAVSHTYTDANILFGAQYYYYVQAGSKISATDQNAHPSERGKTIWTGRIWYPQNTYTFGKRRSQDDLEQIVMVPNPYNYNDPLIRSGYGWTGNRGILFFNLPSTISIKIFSEYGDLIKTIEHNEPLTKAGSDYWDMTNENRQPIASGIYVVVFQTSDGKLSYQKLVVTR